MGRERENQVFLMLMFGGLCDCKWEFFGLLQYLYKFTIILK